MAYVQTVKQFHEESGMDPKLIRALMDIGDIPEFEKEGRGGTRYINMVELKERISSGQFRIRNVTALVKKGETK